jgi:hypothetical protein
MENIEMNFELFNLIDTNNETIKIIDVNNEFGFLELMETQELIKYLDLELKTTPNINSNLIYNINKIIKKRG